MAIPGVGSASLSWLIARSSAMKAELTTLSAQSADGRRGTYYGELGGEANRAISLRGGIARSEAHAAAITRSLGRTAIAQDTLSSLSSIAERFLTEAGKVNRADPGRVASLAENARQAIGQVASLLNAKAGGEYLFNGADAANPPIPRPDDILSTGMAPAIAAAVGTLAPGNGGDVLAATLAAATSNAPGATPFSAYLTDPAQGLAEPRGSTLADDGQAVPTGLFASRNAGAGTGGSEAGGWSRDLLRGLMTLASLKPEQAAAGADFDAVMASVTAGMKSAMTALGQEAGMLGTSESRLEEARIRHGEIGAALTSQLADVEEVDLAATLTAMQDTQTRLQASWKALSMLSGLSLTQFLS